MAGVLFAISSQAGPVSLTTSGVAYAQDFDTMPTAGNVNTPNNAELNAAAFGVAGSGWWQTFGTVGTFVRNNTGDGNHFTAYSAGIAGAGVATDRAFGLGIQSATSFSAVGAQLQNNTAAAITSLDISYDGEMWYMGAIKTVPDTMKFAYSLDATSLTTGTWTDVTALDFSSPFTSMSQQFVTKDGNDAANRTAGIAASITSLNIPDGATFFVRWYSVDNGGKNDGLLIDNVSITPGGSAASAKLVIISSPASTTAGTASAAFTVQRQEMDNTPITTNTTTVNLTSTSGTGMFRDAGDTVNITSVDITPGNSTASYLYKDNTAGAFTLNHTAPGLTSAAQPITVDPAAIDSYVVTASTPQTVDVPFNTTVTAKDAFSNTVSSDSSTVVTMTSSGSAVFDSNGDSTFNDNTKTLSSGTFTISTKDGVPETITLTATDANTNTGTSASIVVSSTPAGFTKLQLLVPGEAAAPGTPTGKTGTPTAVTAGTAFSVTVNAVDASWNLIASVTDTVGLSSSDPSASLPANAALVGGTRTFTGVQLQTPTMQTITATDISDGSKTPNTSPAITVISTNMGAVVSVDVNWNIEHIVGGVSDFGRERHITVHSSLIENDWNGEEDKLDYLMNDLDVYFGRDNGSAGWKFQATLEDPMRPNHADLAFMTNYGTYLKEQYDLLVDRHPYEARQGEMIMGSNPHPLYPTLSFWPNGKTWTDWQTMDVAASAEWVEVYMDRYFRHAPGQSGEALPKYYEVVNEPDMVLMTGQFMVSNWESIWEYHNLVAEGIRSRLGTNAPLIGGMTWGLHDLWQGDLSRFDSNYWPDLILGNDPTATNGADFYRQAGYTEYPTTGAFGSWEQWDVVWKEFIDHAGSNMDFYAVHFYDWPAWSVPGDGTLRTGGSVEATLDILEWYDVTEFGVENRKPIVLSEYGAVAGYQEQLGLDAKRRAWENLKPFSAMLMQFLERPDYIVKSMPFTVIKATWGDYYNGSTLHRYPYTMMDETFEGSGVWEWTEYIKFFELWSDVDGTRIDTKASDLDIQVDAYVDGNTGYLILNNLEPNAKTIKINAFGASSNAISSVRVKHLYLDASLGAEGQPALTDQILQTAPGSVTVGADATMILQYTFASPVAVDETSTETKFYGESLSGTTPFRVTKSDSQLLTAQINNVTVPAGPAEATLRISGQFWYDFVHTNDARNQITINGQALDFVADWRGERGGQGRWMGVFEVPVPPAYLQANNTVTCKVLNLSTYATVGLQVSEFSQAPGRSSTAPNVPVTGISLSTNSLSLPEQRVASVQATITPANASDRRITWNSSNPSVASVDSLGLIDAVAAGSATVTATTVDGGFTATNQVTVTPFVPFAVTSVRVNPSVRVILLGTNAPLTETVLPANAANQAVTWSSSNPSVATVDSAGVVSAVSAGSATITATTVDGGFTDTSLVTVPPPVAVTGVSLSPASSLVAVGGTLQLTPTVSPSGAADKSVTWSSQNPSGATVDAGGVVTGVSTGTVDIVVTTVDGGFKATNAVTVFLPGISLTIEAETFVATGGVSNNVGVGINWVQAGDWAEYDVVIPEDGTYLIEYHISTPENGTTIEFRLDGVSIVTDAVPNNGAWDDYQPVQSASTVATTSGPHTVRLVAGSAPWQWNLDKFVLTKVLGLASPASGAVIAQSSLTSGDLILTITNGTPNGPFELLSSSNVAIPVEAWMTNQTGLLFDGAGTAIVTNPVTGDQEYFRIRE